MPDQSPDERAGIVGSNAGDQIAQAALNIDTLRQLLAADDARPEGERLISADTRLNLAFALQDASTAWGQIGQDLQDIEPRLPEPVEPGQG